MLRKFILARRSGRWCLEDDQRNALGTFATKAEALAGLRGLVGANGGVVRVFKEHGYFDREMTFFPRREQSGEHECEKRPARPKHQGVKRTVPQARQKSPWRRAIRIR